MVCSYAIENGQIVSLEFDLASDFGARRGRRWPIPNRDGESQMKHKPSKRTDGDLQTYPQDLLDIRTCG